MYDDFTDVERRALLLIKCYEDTRRANGQMGYTVFRKEVVEPRTTQLFAQFKAVVVWIESKGWGVTWKEVNWIGYVKYAFEYMKPSIPYPGQLKNELLLRSYLGSTSVDETVEPERTDEDLERIYKQVVDSRIMDDPKAAMAIGVRRV